MAHFPHSLHSFSNFVVFIAFIAFYDYYAKSSPFKAGCLLRGEEPRQQLRHFGLVHHRVLDLERHRHLKLSVSADSVLMEVWILEHSTCSPSCSLPRGSVWTVPKGFLRLAFTYNAPLKKCTHNYTLNSAPYPMMHSGFHCCHPIERFQHILVLYATRHRVTSTRGRLVDHYTSHLRSQTLYSLAVGIGRMNGQESEMEQNCWQFSLESGAL